MSRLWNIRFVPLSSIIRWSSGSIPMRRELCIWWNSSTPCCIQVKRGDEVYLSWLTQDKTILGGCIVLHCDQNNLLKKKKGVRKVLKKEKRKKKKWDYPRPLLVHQKFVSQRRLNRPCYWWSSRSQRHPNVLGSISYISSIYLTTNC